MDDISVSTIVEVDNTITLTPETPSTLVVTELPDSISNVLLENNSILTVSPNILNETVIDNTDDLDNIILERIVEIFVTATEDDS